MPPDVLILHTRHDKANAALVEWINATLDAAAMSCALSESVTTRWAEDVSLVIAPVAASGWRGLTDGHAGAAVNVGAPVLGVALGEAPPGKWPTLEPTGALRHPLLLPDLSAGSADRLVAAARARLQGPSQVIAIAMHAAPGLEAELRRVLAIMTDASRGFGGRVTFQPLIWPQAIEPKPDGTVCLWWHDTPTPLGGETWAVDEWQTIDWPSAHVFYKRRPASSEDVDGRVTRLARDTADVQAFLERTGNVPIGPIQSRAKAGNPPADFERQLREYLAGRLRTAVATARREARFAPAGALSHCFRCGTHVGPYPPGSVSSDDRFNHGVPNPPGESYVCPRCGEQPSPCLNETGTDCATCGSFNPLSLAYCCYCGHPLR